MNAIISGFKLKKTNMLSRENNFVISSMRPEQLGISQKPEENEALVNVGLAFRQNPEKGLSMLFRAFYDPFCSHASRLVYSREVAEDLVAEVFFQFYLTKGYKNWPANYADYIFKSVVNECYNYLSPEFRETEGFNPLVKSDVSHVDQKPSKDVHYNSLILRMTERLKILPSQSQTIFSLSWFENKSYFEIGQILRMAPKTVEIRIANVIKMMAARSVKPGYGYLGRIYERDFISTDLLTCADKPYNSRTFSIENSKFENVFIIDPETELPVAKQLVLLILNAMDSHLIVDRDKMPSINRLSAYLQVSRSVVERAYNDLKQIGIIVAMHGSAHVIQVPERRETWNLVTVANNGEYDVLWQSLTAQSGNMASFKDQI